MFPCEARLCDLYNGERLIAAQNRCSFPMLKGETRAFAWK